MEANPARWTSEELLGEAEWLAALARALVAEPALAEDVAQEAWIAALEHPPGREKPLRAWLGRVARNAARQRLRADARRRARETRRLDERESLAPDELAARLEGQRLLTDALAELAEPYRSTVLLAYFEHRTGAEIARIQGVAEGTVRWRLKQGLDELRERLDRRRVRAQWAMALVPLARSVAPPGPVASSSMLLTGVLTMYTSWKLAAALAVLVALSLGLVLGGAVSLPFLSAEPEPVPVTFSALEHDAGASVEAPETAPESPAPERATAAVASADTPVPPARVRARFLDEQGAPVAGVRLALRGTGGATAVSGSAGDAELVLALAAPMRLDFVARKSGYATRTLEARIDPSSATPLGDLVLAPGGEVHGLVRDAAGNPVEDVAVGSLDVDRPEREIERMRRRPYGLRTGETVHTDARGRFVLDGIPVGSVRLAAEHPRFLAAVSGTIEVRARQASLGVELVLDPPRAEELILGQVVDPDGTPVPGAWLRWTATLGGGTSSGTDVADEQGNFRFTAAEGERYAIEARDTANRLAPARADDLEGGMPALVLRLGERRSIALEVRDERGEPVAAFRATARLEGMHDVHYLDGRDGTLTLPVPAQTFAVSVLAEGFGEWRSASIAPEHAPVELAVQLVAMPQLRGRALADVAQQGGTPVAGARVSAWRLAERRLEHDGFFSRVDPVAVAETTTDASGTFALSVRKAGKVIVRIDDSVHAPCELGPLDYDPRSGHEGLVGELTAGGAIEGRVLVAPGRFAEGILVGFSRGDGQAFTLRAGAEGRFRAERLVPGPWQVERVEREIVHGRSWTRMGGAAPADEFRGNCAVSEGTTTRFDLDLAGAEGGFTLAGVLTVDGGPAGAWNAEPKSDAERGVEVERPRVDADGRFELRWRTGGEQELALTALEGPLEGLRIAGRVTLNAPRTEWRLDLATGTLAVEGGRTEPGPPLVLVVSPAPGVYALHVLTIDGKLAPKTVTLPAGRVKLVRYDDREALGADPATWPAAAEVDLPARGTARMEVR